MISLSQYVDPWYIGEIKVWPCYSRPGFQWFIAYEGKPYWFRSKAEAMLFAKDKLDAPSDGLCD